MAFTAVPAAATGIRVVHCDNFQSILRSFSLFFSFSLELRGNIHLSVKKVGCPPVDACQDTSIYLGRARWSCGAFVKIKAEYGEVERKRWTLYSLHHIWGYQRRGAHSQWRRSKCFLLWPLFISKKIKKPSEHTFSTCSSLQLPSCSKLRASLTTVNVVDADIQIIGAASLLADLGRHANMTTNANRLPKIRRRKQSGLPSSPINQDLFGVRRWEKPLVDLDAAKERGMWGLSTLDSLQLS